MSTGSAGLFAPRRSRLLVGVRDRSVLIDGVERQIGYVHTALKRIDAAEIEVRGALCFPNVGGLPLFSALRVRDVIIDGPKNIAALAKRPGALTASEIERVWTHLGRSFPQA